jgi:Amt family ammonium transporter
VHGIGGVLGVICLGIFGEVAMNPTGSNGLIYGGTSFFLKQTVAALGAALYAFLFSYVALWIINKVTRVRVTREDEEAGLDAALLGETAYV